MRKQIEYEVGILLKTAPYKDSITWKDIKGASDFINDDDVIVSLTWKEQKVLKFWADAHDSDDFEFALYLYVTRKRLENDEEYVERLKREQQRADEIEKQEHETYLKLKGKYEK